MTHLARICACLAGWLALATPGESACRQALLLALDVSGSVDETEYVLQLNGVATALEVPSVQDAIFAFPDAPLSLAIFEWSASSYQRQILEWTALATPADLAAVTARLRAWRRGTAPEATGLGGALRYAARTMQGAPVCWRRTLDVSGDGKNNDWPLPRDIRNSGVLAGVVINGLIIGQDVLRSGDDRLVGVAELSAYFRANVLQGPDAFLEVALGYEDYAAAMARKLLKEISSPPLGYLPPARGPAPRRADTMPGSQGSVDVADLIAPVPLDILQ